MNLVIDIGNSSVKVVIIDGGVTVMRERFPSADPDRISGFIGRVRIDRAIVSSVGTDPSPLLDWLSKKTIKVHLLTCRSEYPFAIDYDTPETLGTDRLAAAAGAFHHHPGADLLIIDAGSALTIDQVTGGVYRGGSISPGLSMRFRALHEFTGRLPLVTAATDFTFPGRTTADAIAGGVLTGMVYEINEYIRTFGEKNPDPVTVITGGDGAMLSARTCGNLLFYPDLVTEGLNFLLETNVQKHKS